MAKKKVVVAFSGGLDTSYTVMKLTKDGWDVYAACANTGGFSEEQLKITVPRCLRFALWLLNTFNDSTYSVLTSSTTTCVVII